MLHVVVAVLIQKHMKRNRIVRKKKTAVEKQNIYDIR